ncbi:MAG: hypothetical protein ACR2PY_02935 [Salinispira sp.]
MEMLIVRMLGTFVLFCVFTSCNSFIRSDTIILNAESSSEDQLIVSAVWKNLSSRISERVHSSRFEQVIEYRLTVYSRTFPVERMSISRNITVAYLPSGDLYYLADPYAEYEQYFDNPISLYEYLDAPLRFVIPLDTLRDDARAGFRMRARRGEGLRWSARLRAYIPRVSEESAFWQWLSIINPYVYMGRGEINEL